jgi:NitT/TauT family transport system ATP-binding protein
MMVSESDAQVVVEAKSLDLTFQTNDGPVQALKDVNLTINKGDFVRVRTH